MNGPKKMKVSQAHSAGESGSSLTPMEGRDVRIAASPAVWAWEKGRDVCS